MRPILNYLYLNCKIRTAWSRWDYEVWCKRGTQITKLSIRLCRERNKMTTLTPLTTTFFSNKTSRRNKHPASTFYNQTTVWLISNPCFFPKCSFNRQIKDYYVKIRVALLRCHSQTRWISRIGRARSTICATLWKPSTLTEMRCLCSQICATHTSTQVYISITPISKTVGWCNSWILQGVVPH